LREDEEEVNSVRLALGGDLGTVGLRGVGEVSILNDRRISASNRVRQGERKGLAYVVPCTCTSIVRTLITLEPVDEHTLVQVLVDRAHAARGGARHVVRAVGLMDVLELARVVGP
jgi:hypothetical protein